MKNKMKNKINFKRYSSEFFLIFFVVLLCCIGFVFIYSASNYSAGILYGDSLNFVTKQIIGFAIGIVLMLLISKFNYNNFSKLHMVLAIVSIVVLLMVFIPGISIDANGARRWIGFGPLSIQSSEIAKFGL